MLNVSKCDIGFFSTENVALWLPKHAYYSPSYNLTPPVSGVLTSQQLIFCLMTSPTCCNSPRKCTPVKSKNKQKAGFPIVTY